VPHKKSGGKVAGLLVGSWVAGIAVPSTASADMVGIPRADQAAILANCRRENPLKNITSLVVERAYLYW
jgi:hypothetical protein